MQELMTPTLREVLAGYERFNEWERAERRGNLGVLSVEESILQFFELCEFVRPFRPAGVDPERATEHKQAGWITLYRRLL